MLALLKIFGPLLGKIAAGPVLDIIDKLVPDADLKTRLKAEIRESLARRDIALTAARREAVLSELRSDSWMTRSWRPALMLLFMAFLLFFGLILPLMELFAGQPLAVEPHLDRIPEPLWNLLALGVGGYVGGRTVEKIAAHWARPTEPRPSSSLAKARSKRCR
jgi:Holin of 3TMs, for gene-transfer release